MTIWNESRSIIVNYPKCHLIVIQEQTNESSKFFINLNHRFLMERLKIKRASIIERK